ncbi:MAG: energy transducer TonB, partial [Candidatus Omnitrophica bacterium]|nr:energy transducer TonB [Candidatus Omnitrophota bacterium]
LYFPERINIALNEPDSRTGESEFKIEGPAGEREIIFRPETFTIQRGLYGDKEEHVVRLRFFVSDNGIVYDVKPLISSGYPGIDLQAIRFLKRWRFSPSRSDQDKAAVWGDITVKMDVE